MPTHTADLSRIPQNYEPLFWSESPAAAASPPSLPLKAEQSSSTTCLLSVPCLLGFPSFSATPPDLPPQVRASSSSSSSPHLLFLPSAPQSLPPITYSFLPHMHRSPFRRSVHIDTRLLPSTVIGSPGFVA
jgi:hypothetical protein